ncbi:hypothetical protein HCBG_03065 [Histoplasma capsulatum G186AR]|uniref:Uncharacterized protein n=2 Tax=Ajellomyces capsulatus TaxID=5037 RepID=C0NI93_AJECG|nr:uncharacterized protein HCBG_03065 [Histoplasma capsulatum G186AR]EEH09528.1 hypothetical protein HCBG_03065 [Histoplasma capsulatum G186AR]KAG5300311.1 hypothetical protein I7I52_10888 [Histoplasma capsulatum]QSS68730.1 hypothetical protein I7I50_09795 [Histoplasma capsulatum G186AR]
MGLVTVLSQLMLLGLASSQIVKDPLMERVRDLDGEFAAALPDPQKYTLKTWPAEDITRRGMPPDIAWGGSVNEPQSRFYCRDDFSIYNVTFPDCPEPWLVGHCAKAEMDREASMNLIARLPSGARAAISDLLVVALEKGLVLRHGQGNSALFGGVFRPADSLKMLATAMYHGYPGIPNDDFVKAVAADTCVGDKPAADNLKKDGSYRTAIESGLMIAAYLKIVKPPLDASCMRNQLNVLEPILNKLWDAKTGCPNKVAPKLIQHKSVLFRNGLGELGSDPIQGAKSTEVTKWDKSEGVPEYCWKMAEGKRDDGRVRCTADRLDVYNVTYSDCLDQDPWAICRCNDAQQSLDKMVEYFGRVPAGLRSRVRHLIAFEDNSPGGVRVGPWNIIAIYGDASDSVYMHESGHCTDRDFSRSEAFQKAKAADSCWPSEYSRSNDRELFAELGVAYLYDNSGKTLRERGYDASCLGNELKALGEYVGSEYKKGSKCFKREPNSKIIHPAEAQAGRIEATTMSEEFDGTVEIETFP